MGGNAEKSGALFGLNGAGEASAGGDPPALGIVDLRARGKAGGTLVSLSAHSWRSRGRYKMS